jgi:hypothetical protein
MSDIGTYSELSLWLATMVKFFEFKVCSFPIQIFLLTPIIFTGIFLCIFEVCFGDMRWNHCKFDHECYLFYYAPESNHPYSVSYWLLYEMNEIKVTSTLRHVTQSAKSSVINMFHVIIVTKLRLFLPICLFPSPFPTKIKVKIVRLCPSTRTG